MRAAPSLAAGVVQIGLATTLITAGAVAVGALTDDEAGSETGFEPTEVRREPCPESRFECVTITVPRDHDAPGTGDVWEITYAVQRATGDRLGTFVTITGGPGSAGIASADFYTDSMPTPIPEHYDMVFLNQRGSGPFRPLRCDESAATYYRASFDATDRAARDEIEAIVRAFVDGCIAEGEIAVDDLPYYGTQQAAADLELVRRHLGADELTLYGESYGTQFVQTYAAAHPERVAALLLDGVVDLTVESSQWYDEAARAYDDALRRTLDACVDDALCAADASTDDLLAAYDELDRRLDEAPIPVALPMPDGSTAARELTAADLAIAVSGNVGSFSGRMQLLRVLNAAINDNPVPLLRMALQYVYLDPETLDVVPDPSWSDALFYAVECQDYSFHPEAGTPRQRLDRWLDDHVAGGNADLRLGDVALGDLPCLYWPAQPGSVDRPEAIVDPPYPTLVLTADTDPATPMVSALRVFSRLDDAYLVTLQDGPHVIFAWGYECVDDLVAGFLVEGERPTRITVCDGDLIDPYAPIPPDTPDELEVLTSDPAAFALSVTTELVNNVEYSLWWGDDTLEFGCDFGGVAVYEPTDAGAAVSLDACELTDGYPLSGTATIGDVVELTIETADGSLTAVIDDATVRAGGTWNGDEFIDELAL